MKIVKPGDNKPRNLKRDYKDMVIEAWHRLYPGDMEAKKQAEWERLWAAEEVHRKAKAKL